MRTQEGSKLGQILRSYFMDDPYYYFIDNSGSRSYSTLRYPAALSNYVKIFCDPDITYLATITINLDIAWDIRVT